MIIFCQNIILKLYLNELNIKLHGNIKTRISAISLPRAIRNASWLSQLICKDSTQNCDLKNNLFSALYWSWSIGFHKRINNHDIIMNDRREGWLILSVVAWKERTKLHWADKFQPGKLVNFSWGENRKVPLYFHLLHVGNKICDVVSTMSLNHSPLTFLTDIIVGGGGGGGWWWVCVDNQCVGLSAEV